jgi:hypothetical protein
MTTNDRTRNRYLKIAQFYERKAANKLAVAARHAPGTAYHTRAIREAEVYQQRAEAYRSWAEGMEEL